MGVIIILSLLSIPWIYNLLKSREQINESFGIEFFYFILFNILFIAFVIALKMHSSQYYEAIDVIDSDYSPISYHHLLTYFIFTLFYLISLGIIWLKGKKTPPLTYVICQSFLLIGFILNVFLIIQFSSRTENNCSIYDTPSYEMILFPIYANILTFVLLIQSIIKESEVSRERKYKNKFLNYLNSFIANSKFISPWIILLIFPLLFITTILLILFGQNYDSLMKLFTETTTWTFSQKTHPPFLDHKGHYLCTVAACGDPKIVKPIRIGNRHGNQIIVNRQLQIANAYEEMIQDYSPRLHRFIRKNYDKYGYPFSKNINTPFRSNIIYILMKPLEWIFLVKIYLFCSEPEKKIMKQYAE